MLSQNKHADYGKELFRVDRGFYLIAFIFFVVSGGALLFFSKLSGVSGRGGGNVLFQLISLTIYGVCFYLVIRNHAKSALFIVFQSWPLVLLLVLCFFSFLWSVEASTSIRRSIALVLSFLFCLYVVCRYQQSHIIYMIWFVCVLIAGFGFVAVALPGWGIDPNNYSYSMAWRGLSGHKNDFGRYMALGLITSIYLMFFSNFRKIIFAMMSAVFFAFLILSQAKTPLASALLVLCLYPAIRFYVVGNFIEKNRAIFGTYSRMVILTVCTALVITCGYLVVEYMILALGKDLTLTGRTTIWSYALMIGEDRQWLGAGYRTFWGETLTGDFDYYNPYWVTVESFRNGHNGLIDVYLELGYMGFFLFLLFLAVFFKKLFLTGKSCTILRREYIYFMSIFMFYLIYSVTEQVTLKQSEFLWMILMMFFLCISKNFKLRRLRGEGVLKI
ncbi:hypothetical protein AMJAP_0855 [Amphritea japonica ATCC BAA-1530]|uniref:O-antigen ligase-related domain-containing protein n=2 Tax=Amphritea TaxID=515417 RepID=A0A7R6SRP1_9GAMM|nr:hypothetical protein AMJAP_0855 [Amphritea japonica ATCC BAA-1530]